MSEALTGKVPLAAAEAGSCPSWLEASIGRIKTLFHKWLLSTLMWFMEYKIRWLFFFSLTKHVCWKQKIYATFFLHWNIKIEAICCDFLIKKCWLLRGNRLLDCSHLICQLFGFDISREVKVYHPLTFRHWGGQRKIETGLSTSQKSKWRKFTCEISDYAQQCPIWFCFHH